MALVSWLAGIVALVAGFKAHHRMLSLFFSCRQFLFSYRFFNIDIAEPGFLFDPAVEGDVITHEFTIRNTGTAPLEILKVQSG